jgi:uncharacterized protein (TIGR04255 family)
MAEYEVFANSPVEEAIITIRLPLLENPGPRAEALSSALRASYPIVEGGDRKGESPHYAAVARSGREFECLRLLSADRQQVVQVTSKSFSYHRLRPYDQWEAFVQRARKAWDAFVPLFRPSNITEVQLRYVNVFDLPMPFEDWSEYLVIRPEVPPPVDTGLVSYMMCLNLTDQSVPASAVVTQSTEADHDDVAQVLLDIDTRTRIDAGESSEEHLWRTLDRLREYKNRLFFEGITERAKELFR